MVLWKTKKWGNFSPSPHPTSAILGGLFAPSLQRTQDRIQLLTQDALDEVLCGEKIQARDWDSWLSRCPWSPSNSSILLFLLKNKEIIYLLIACINTCNMACVWRSEHSLWYLLPCSSLFDMGIKLRLSGLCFSMRSHLAIPERSFPTEPFLPRPHLSHTCALPCSLFFFA